MKLLIIPLILLSLAYGAYLFISPRISQDKRCKSIYSKTFHEVVAKKYRMPSNKNLPEFAFVSGQRLVITAGFEPLYESAEIGDTLTKDTASFQFAVHKADTVLAATVFCQ